MVEFIPVTKEEAEKMKGAASGRRSWSKDALMSFLELDPPMHIAKFESEKKRTAGSLSVTLTTCIKRHSMPIKAFIRGGELYLMRLDIDEHGNPIPDWKRKYYPEEFAEEEEAKDEDDDDIPELSSVKFD